MALLKLTDICKDYQQGKEPVRVLKNVEGIGICELNNQDVVRHVMVQRIVKAYEQYEQSKNGGKKK